MIPPVDSASPTSLPRRPPQKRQAGLMPLACALWMMLCMTSPARCTVTPQAYLDTVRRTIESAFPPYFTEAYHSVTVGFFITTGGHIGDLRITSSSRNLWFDSLALETVLCCTPFEPPPGIFAAENIPLSFTFVSTAVPGDTTIDNDLLRKALNLDRSEQPAKALRLYQRYLAQDSLAAHSCYALQRMYIIYDQLRLRSEQIRTGTSIRARCRKTTFSK